MPDPVDDPAERVRTPLLTLLTEEALERDYQVVAQRRAASTDPAEPGGAHGPGSGARWGVIAVIAVFGLLVTLAAVQTQANADIQDAGRATLIDRIESRREQVRELQADISEQRAANAQAERELLALGEAVNALESRVLLLEGITGFAAVRGEGVRIQLDNAPYADPETEQIRDSDLAMLVNGLWTSGAEAISINGQRLTARTAIRNAGSAIEVNSTGIAPPYTVLATGDMDTLASRFLESGSGEAFYQLASQYGFSIDMDNVDDLRLPAAPQRLRQLRSAEEAVTPGQRPEGDLTP